MKFHIGYASVDNSFCIHNSLFRKVAPSEVSCCLKAEPTAMKMQDTPTFDFETCSTLQIWPSLTSVIT